MSSAIIILCLLSFSDLTSQLPENGFNRNKMSQKVSEINCESFSFEIHDTNLFAKHYQNENSNYQVKKKAQSKIV